MLTCSSGNKSRYSLEVRNNMMLWLPCSGHCDHPWSKQSASLFLDFFHTIGLGQFFGLFSDISSHHGWPTSTSSLKLISTLAWQKWALLCLDKLAYSAVVGNTRRTRVTSRFSASANLLEEVGYFRWSSTLSVLKPNMVGNVDHS